MLQLFSPVFLGEKVGFRRWSAVIIGFIGSLVVIRPGFVEINLASIAALGTGVMYGFYLIITRKTKYFRQSFINFIVNWCSRGHNYITVMPFVWVKPTLISGL